MKAVLFDLDGTLANTLDDIADAMNWALENNGLPTFPTDIYRYMVGDGISWLAKRAVGSRQELKEKVQEEYRQRYSEYTLVKTAPYPGIPELLRGLKERGLKLCVLSNKPDADTQRVIGALFPPDTFDLVRGQVPGVPVKPDPTGAIMAARKLRLKPEDFFYLGDTAVDMTCAIRTGMRPVGVLWGFRAEDELRGAGAETVIADPLDLLPLIGE